MLHITSQWKYFPIDISNLPITAITATVVRTNSSVKFVQSGINQPQSTIN